MGLVPESLLRRAPLPQPRAVYDYATYAVQRELAYPHTARFPPLDSATVMHNGNGHFVVSGRVSAVNGNAERRSTHWQVMMRRRYAPNTAAEGFLVDSLAFNDKLAINRLRLPAS